MNYDQKVAKEFRCLIDKVKGSLGIDDFHFKISKLIPEKGSEDEYDLRVEFTINNEYVYSSQTFRCLLGVEEDPARQCRWMFIDAVKGYFAYKLNALDI
jgi:hypothetical protein